MNTMNRLILCALSCIFNLTAFANSDSPYVGQESRVIKSLSEQEVEGYLSGKGLGYAKAAELNQFPGPNHVLQLAKELNLTEQQQVQTQAIFKRMQAQASALGKQFVAKEQELNNRFADGSIDSSSLQRLVLEIGELQAKIRLVHLNAHLEQKALLSERQIQLYDQLRGYGDADKREHNHEHSQHH